MDYTEAQRKHLGLFGTCKRAAQRMLLDTGGTYSSDLGETIAQTLFQVCTDRFSYTADEEDEKKAAAFCASAVSYLMDTAYMPPMGASTAWFEPSLSVLFELAYPNSGFDAMAEDMLLKVQEGVRATIATLPMSMSNLSMDDDDARTIDHLVDASVEYGAVSDMLEVVEILVKGDPIDEDMRRQLFIFAQAAPLSRRRRAENN